jgi:hypothetical protein
MRAVSKAYMSLADINSMPIGLRPNKNRIKEQALGTAFMQLLRAAFASALAFIRGNRLL